MSERHWKLINIVSVVAKLGNICCGRKICVRERKMFLTSGKNIFCFRATKFVSATYASIAAKLGNICFRNNDSYLSQALSGRYLTELAIKLYKKFWNKMNCRLFCGHQMRTPKSPFESYKSKRIWFQFANLFFSAVSGPKALKKSVCVSPYSSAVKSYRTFSK